MSRLASMPAGSPLAIFPETSLSLSDFAVGALFQGRLVRVDDNTYALIPWNGNRVLAQRVGGLPVIGTLPNGGLQQAIAARTIDAAGADSGGNMAASTFYNIYLGGPDVSFSPNSLRGSTVTPTLCTDGIWRLGALGSGNATGWLWVGALYVSAAGTLLDVNNTRHIASLFNSTLQRVHQPINYNDNGAVTVFNLASANWAPIAGSGAIGGQDTLSFIDLGIDDFQAQLQFAIGQTAAAEWSVGLGTDTSTAINNFWQGGPVAAGVGAGGFVGAAIRNAGGPGRRSVIAKGRSAAAANLQFIADGPRNGASADPIGCFFSILGKF